MFEIWKKDLFFVVLSSFEKDMTEKRKLKKQPGKYALRVCFESPFYEDDI